MATHQWILLILELLCGLLAQVANADDARIESLIAIKQSGDGVELSIFPKYFGIKSPASESTLTKLVPNRQLSIDCGDEYFRCKPLPVTTLNTTNETIYQLLVPLSGGLLIMELKFQPVNNSNMVFGAFRILDTRDCNPTTIFKLYDSHYTMCTNLRNKLVSLYEIRVNKTSIERTEISGPLVTVEQLADFTDASDVVNMSNFLVSTDDPRIPYIYFAVDNYLFAITPLDFSVDFDFVQLGTTRCRYIHRLVRVSSSQILAYCSSEFVYFNTEYEDWVSEHSYPDSGVPYICPNEMYGVSAFQDYLEYSVGSRKGTLSRVNVDSGVCFSGTGGQNYFVYNDKVTDTTTLMNLTSPSQTQMQLCEDMGCLPVVAVEDPIQYLIVRQLSSDGLVHVLDIEANFSTIISAKHRTSDMFTVVHVKSPLYPSPSELPPRKKTHLIIPLIAGGLIIIALITVVIITAVVLGYRIITHKRITKQTVPLPESQSTCILTNHLAFAYEAPQGQGQPSYQDPAAPCPVLVSPSGETANSMQAGGNRNSSLGQLGEEEERLREKKFNEDYTLPDNEKIVGPGNILRDSTSLAGTAPPSFDPEAMNTSGPILAATTAADSDTGSEDSRMNSDREPLLENSSNC